MSARARGGQLVVENVALLCGNGKTFLERYKVSLSEDSFRNPGNVKTAYPLLHFLLCQIDPEGGPGAFKPCFPIRDREQERDFRKVVDTSLSVLERSKLIQVGVARKSVVASAGGDKFEQLMWTLSTLALQQAALRHPAQATAHSLAPQPVALDGVEGKRRYAALLRTRIASERAAFARTTQMGRDASLRWAEEVQELRDRIAAVEGKREYVRKELFQLGFDADGIDLRAREIGILGLEKKAAGEELGRGRFRTASIGKPVLMKSSPVESDESVSVEETEINGRGNDAKELKHNLNRLLAFSKEPHGIAHQAERIVTEFDNHEDAILGNDISSSLRPRSIAQDDTFDAATLTKPCSDIADLVQAAVSELEKATSRMNLIASQRASVISDISRDPSLENDLTTTEGNGNVAEDCAELNQKVEKSLALHHAIVESTNTLAKTAGEVARDAATASNAELLGKEGGIANAKDSADLVGNLLALSRASVVNDDPPDWVADVEVMDEFDDAQVFEVEGDSSGNLAKVESQAVECGTVEELDPTLEKMDVDTPLPGDAELNETEMNGVDISNDDLLPIQALQSKMVFLKDLERASEIVQTVRESPPPPPRGTKAKKNSLRKAGGFSMLNRLTSDELDPSIPFYKVPLSKMPKRKKNGMKTVRFAETVTTIPRTPPLVKTTTTDTGANGLLPSILSTPSPKKIPGTHVFSPIPGTPYPRNRPGVSNFTPDAISQTNAATPTPNISSSVNLSRKAYSSPVTGRPGFERQGNKPDIVIEDDKVSITSSNENGTQMHPRRSLSTPGRFPSQSQTPASSSRLISFPSLHGFRRREDKSAGRRSSLIGGDEDRFFPWRGDRKSTSAHSDGRPVRSPSRIFSASGRLPAMLSRKNTGGPSSSSSRRRREEQDSGSPRQSRVKSLRARLAALI